MNHCRKCQSDYEKPGTCNCFAEQTAPMPVPLSSSFYGPWWGILPQFSQVANDPNAERPYETSGYLQIDNAQAQGTTTITTTNGTGYFSLVAE